MQDNVNVALRNDQQHREQHVHGCVFEKTEVDTV
jgi:hypothetical protein